MGLFELVKKKYQACSISFRVAILVALFGSGSWIEMNGIWVELPILVRHSPQSWSLPSYLTVAVALANVGPILYALCYRYARYKGRKLVKEVPVIYVSILTGVIATLLLAFTWQKTNVINGTSYSTALIGLAFCLSLVDCTSSVTFMPYMTRLKKEYMSIYFMGEGLSGLVPSLIALIQGVGKQNYTCEPQTDEQNRTVTSSNPDLGQYQVLMNVTEIVPRYFSTEPRFSAQVFFLLLFVMMVVCLAAFMCLNCLSISKAERVVQKETSQIHPKDDTHHSCWEHGRSMCQNNDCPVNTSQMTDLQNKEGKQSGTLLIDNTEESESNSNIGMASIATLLLAMGVINVLSNGVLPSVQSYACLPYGNRIYHLVLTLSAIINPVACFFYYYVSTKSIVKTIILTIIYVGTCIYIVAIAATSPCPILQSSDLGGVIILLVCVGGVGLCSYIKTAIGSILRDHSHKALVWSGVSMQVGSCIGAIIMFPIVNSYNLFTQSQPCKACPY